MPAGLQPYACLGDAREVLCSCRSKIALPEHLKMHSHCLPGLLPGLCRLCLHDAAAITGCLGTYHMPPMFRQVHGISAKLLHLRLHQG